MRRFRLALTAGIVVLVLGPAASAPAQAPTTFVAPLSAENEVPGCPQGVDAGAKGRAIVQIDEETGEIRYRVVAVKLPGSVTDSPGAHIHVGSAGSAGGVVQPLDLTGRPTGLVAAGTATNPTLAAAILANPAGYYVNVHTDVCPGGAVRGQIG
jgi:hypothetical protein